MRREEDQASRGKKRLYVPGVGGQQAPGNGKLVSGTHIGDTKWGALDGEVSGRDTKGPFYSSLKQT